jgi:hypothetical protein
MLPRGQCKPATEIPRNRGRLASILHAVTTQGRRVVRRVRRLVLGSRGGIVEDGEDVLDWLAIERACAEKSRLPLSMHPTMRVIVEQRLPRG